MSDEECDPVFIPSHPERPIVSGGGGPALDADPWAHRAISMRCSSCMWFVVKASKFTKVGDEMSGRSIGRCRRHAPSHISIGWPVVFGTDWCGDHKLDEDKI